MTRRRPSSRLKDEAATQRQNDGKARLVVAPDASYAPVMASVPAASPRWVEALAFIIERIVRSGTSPSYGDIARALKVSRKRGADYVAQLIERGLIEKTPGAQRDLRVRDVRKCRALLEDHLRNQGWIASDPLGPLRQAFTHVHLPILSPFEHIPDDN